MVRNLAEMGENLQKIMACLTNNEDLVKLLYYTDKDPISQPALTAEQIKKEVFNKLILIVPKYRDDTAQSAISIIIDNGISIGNNREFQNIQMSIYVYVPMTQWIIKSDSLRPFLIMGNIQKSLENKTINGLGKILCDGFNLEGFTEEMSIYKVNFRFVTYD